MSYDKKGCIVQICKKCMLIKRRNNAIEQYVKSTPVHLAALLVIPFNCSVRYVLLTGLNLLM